MYIRYFLKGLFLVWFLCLASLLTVVIVDFILISDSGLTSSYKNRHQIASPFKNPVHVPNDCEKSMLVYSPNEEVKPEISVHKEKVITEIEKEQKPTEEKPNNYISNNKNRLTPSKGVFNGPSGKETYYNLDMSGVINDMRSKGFSAEQFPFWVREDGAKMLGDFVMVAANLKERPKGTILESSLGPAIVCDTGTFANENQTQIDIAVNW